MRLEKKLVGDTDRAGRAVGLDLGILVFWGLMEVRLFVSHLTPLTHYLHTLLCIPYLAD